MYCLYPPPHTHEGNPGHERRAYLIAVQSNIELEDACGFAL